MGRQSKYGEVEELLRNYKMLKVSICNVEEELELLSQESGVGGMSYDDIGGGATGETSDMVSDIAIRNLEKKDELQKIVRENESKVSRIERSLGELGKISRTIVTEFYIEDKQWWQIAGKVHLGERQCKRKRSRAINKLITGIFGDEDRKS